MNKKIVLLNAENIKQMQWGAINGCEAASLLEGLHLKNKITEVSYGEFLKTMPISKSGNPYEGFGGSPYKNQPGKFEAIFTRPLKKWASRFDETIDLDGSDPDTFYSQLQKENPVLVFVTVHFESPQWEEYAFGRAPENNHAVLLDGIDYQKDLVHLSDPIDGKYWLKKEKFERIYATRKMALSIL